MYERRRAPVLPLKAFAGRLALHASLVVALLVVSLAIGMAGFHAIDDMSWLDAFLPDGFALAPVAVDDRSDGYIVHLDGLNLSRAWCMRGIAHALPAGDPRGAALHAAASDHFDAGMQGLASGDYAGAHWLATFATLALNA